MVANGISNLQDDLLERLARPLRDLGFSARLQQQRYVREELIGEWIVHVGFARHRSDVDATIDLAIRSHALEKLFKRSGDSKAAAATVGAELGNIVDGRPRRWTIAAVTDIDAVAREMSQEIQRFGLAWFQRFATLPEIYSTLRRHDRSSWLYSPIHSRRCLTVVALALALGGMERAQEVASDCRSYLFTRRDLQLAEYDVAVAKLLATSE